ncbi:MAG TPA: TolC family protein, partial [Rhodopila sp.]|uniref:TolC family protein n=1 Tax=Rhodopila sp. TaxID=2480087 RepID=UPI002CDF8ABC
MGPRHILIGSFSLLALAAATSAHAQPKAPPPPGAATPTMLVRSAQRPPKTTARPVAARPAIRNAASAPRTLTEALAATYANQPALQAERAKLRATDENVPTALAGWRPTVVLAGSAGYGDGVSRAYTSTLHGYLNSQTDRLLGTAQATVTQNIYTGGRTQANVNKAKNQVYAERATLLGQEQTSFTNAVQAYVGVIQAKQLLAL